MKKIKKWFNENGFVGAMSLVVALIASLYGLWFLFWGAVGFFVGKNLEILKNLWNDKYKDKVDDFVDSVGDKIKGK